MQRVFIPGSEWIYFKIYTGTKSADNILVDQIRFLTDKLLNEGKIVYYFYIRYSDPDFHIRLRFKISDYMNYGETMRSLCDLLYPLVESGVISKILCDTYVRELERYGTNTIEIAEQLFYIDSAANIELIKGVTEVSSSEQDNIRWQIAILSIDNWLETLGYNDLFSKDTVISKIADGFKKEFMLTSSSYTKQLNDKYRNNRKLIKSVMSEESKSASNYMEILKRRYLSGKKNLEPIMLDNEYIDTGVAKDSFTASILHMSMNRLFRTNQRLVEMTLYDFLSRYYKSEIAVEKYNPKL